VRCRSAADTAVISRVCIANVSRTLIAAASQSWNGVVNIAAKNASPTSTSDVTRRSPAGELQPPSIAPGIADTIEPTREEHEDREHRLEHHVERQAHRERPRARASRRTAFRRRRRCARPTCRWPAHPLRDSWPNIAEINTGCAQTRPAGSPICRATSVPGWGAEGALDEVLSPQRPWPSSSVVFSETHRRCSCTTMRRCPHWRYRMTCVVHPSTPRVTVQRLLVGSSASDGRASC